MAFFAGHSSAGVYVKEIDKSLRHATISTSTGAIVAPSKKGPVGERTHVTSVFDFISKFGEPDASIGFGHHAAIGFLKSSNSLYFTRVARDAKYGGVVFAIENNLVTSRTLTQGIEDPENFVWNSKDILLICGQNPGKWNDGTEVSIYPKDDSNLFVIEIYHEGIQVEVFEVTLNYQLNGFGVQIRAEEYVNRRSDYIKVYINEDNLLYQTDPTRALINTYVAPEQLRMGDDGIAVTDGDYIDGWELYRSTEEVEVSILLNGGRTSIPVQHKMIEIAEDRMDAFAILDIPSSYQMSAQDMVDFKNNQLLTNSTYAGLYGPDIYINDDYNGMTLYVPPSGHVGAAFSEVDEKYGCWWAPAGMENGRIECLGVRDLYDLGQRNLLEDNQINLIRLIRGSGIRIFGASTATSTPSALQNVNVRRMMSYLEKHIAHVSLHAVYKLNDIYLRTLLKTIAINIIQPVKAKRGIYWYEVVCDESNNPPHIIASGDTVLDIYVDPTIPSKRIHINAIVLKTGGIKTAASYAS